MRNWLAIFLVAGLAAGCEIWNPSENLNGFFGGIGTPAPQDPTAEIRRQEYHSWAAAIRDAVDRRLVLVGMTKNQVQVALHLEEKRLQKGAIATPNSPVESWVVWRRLTGWSPVKIAQSQMVTITFRNGVVTAIDTTTQN